MADRGEEIDLVLTKPFSRQTFEEKLDIVKKRSANPEASKPVPGGKRLCQPFSSQ